MPFPLSIIHHPNQHAAVHLGRRAKKFEKCFINWNQKLKLTSLKMIQHRVACAVVKCHANWRNLTIISDTTSDILAMASDSERKKWWLHHKNMHHSMEFVAIVISNYQCRHTAPTCIHTPKSRPTSVEKSFILPWIWKIGENDVFIVHQKIYSVLTARCLHSVTQNITLNVKTVSEFSSFR